MRTKIFLMIALFIFFEFSPANSFSLINKILKPEFFGIYLATDGELLLLEENEVSFDATRGVGLKKPPQIEVKDKNIYFILFDDKISSRDITLHELKYDRKLWTLGEDIKLKIAPIKDEQYMYRLVPYRNLTEGVYAIIYGNLSMLYDQRMNDVKKEFVHAFIYGDTNVVLKEYNSIHRKIYNTIKIGINAPITGAIPKVGEETKSTALMWSDEVNKNGGLEIGGKKYKIELVIKDNESKAEAAVYLNTKMIIDDEVLIIIGPQSSKQAVPAGAIANYNRTPMISPWSTHPLTTLKRPFVFRTAFMDSLQGIVIANFVKNEFGFKKAAVLYDATSDYPTGLAEFFKKAWEDLNGPFSVVAYESFATGDPDYRSQLTNIINSGAEFLFTPQFPYEVALIVQQAHQLGLDKTIVGSDSLGSNEIIRLCGPDCYGLFFSTHYTAVGATGKAQEFIKRYQSIYGYIPSDVGALTWDAMNIVSRGIQNCGRFSGDINIDRLCLRDAITKIRDIDGITGKISFFDNDGNPIKCAAIVKINKEGEFEHYKYSCP